MFSAEQRITKQYTHGEEPCNMYDFIIKSEAAEEAAAKQCQSSDSPCLVNEPEPEDAGKLQMAPVAQAPMDKLKAKKAKSDRKVKRLQRRVEKLEAEKQINGDIVRRAKNWLDNVDQLTFKEGTVLARILNAE